jgi:CheY-like chemotaxis protein
MAPSTPPAGRSGPILIVDDDPVLREFISMALAEQGYRTETACDGVQALTLVQRELPSLILADVGVPVLGGSEFAARVRETTGSPVPCLVMSGGMLDGEDDASVVGYLAKPFDLDDLFGAVQRVVGAPRPAQTV